MQSIRGEKRASGLLTHFMFGFLFLSALNLAYFYRTSTKLSEIEHLVNDFRASAGGVESHLNSSKSSGSANESLSHNLKAGSAIVTESDRVHINQPMTRIISTPSHPTQSMESGGLDLHPVIPASAAEALTETNNSLKGQVIAANLSPKPREYRKIRWTYSFSATNTLVLEQIHPEDAVAFGKEYTASKRRLPVPAAGNATSDSDARITRIWIWGEAAHNP